MLVPKFGFVFFMNKLAKYAIIDELPYQLGKPQKSSKKGLKLFNTKEDEVRNLYHSLSFYFDY